MVALVYFIACVIVVFILAIRRASLEAWAIAAALAALIWQTGLIDGRLHAPTLGLSGLIGWLPAIVLRRCRSRRCARAGSPVPSITASRRHCLGSPTPGSRP